MRPEQPDRRARRAGRVGAPPERAPGALRGRRRRGLRRVRRPERAPRPGGRRRGGSADRGHADVLEDLRPRGPAPRLRGRRRAARGASSTSSRSPSTSTAPPWRPEGRACAAPSSSRGAGWRTSRRASAWPSGSARPARPRSLPGQLPARRRRRGRPRPHGGTRAQGLPRPRRAASSACRASSGSRRAPPLMERFAETLAEARGALLGGREVLEA